MDFDSEDENSYSFTTAIGESSEAANSQQLPGIPDLNSTMTHQSLEIPEEIQRLGSRTGDQTGPRR